MDIKNFGKLTILLKNMGVDVYNSDGTIKDFDAVVNAIKIILDEEDKT